MPFTPPHPGSIPLTSSFYYKAPSGLWFYNDRVREPTAALTPPQTLPPKNQLLKTGALLQAVVSVLPTGASDIRREHWLNWCRGFDSHSSLGEMWRQLQVIAGNKGPHPTPHPDPSREAEGLASSFATRTCTDNLPAETRDGIDGSSCQQEMIK
ncbi:hypothetical protein GWK47_048524 [Chionoecetes opilio]|uniref:Uncharacterized protein n=1 Tax=Chionoecetes opilio TaxID=41210 RepID=A0A8J4YA68_CHIOP|nr:hypothetical protein GWK47_048524 [Chionoecetes opilio]